MYISYNQTMLVAKHLQHITKELHRFMGQTCTRTFAVHITETRLYKLHKKTTKIQKHINHWWMVNFPNTHFAQNEFYLDDVNS